MFNRRNSKAPMRADSYKRFSIYKRQEKRDIGDFLFDWLVKGVFASILISINFLLFASSANYSLFSENYNIVPQILLPILAIFFLIIFVMFLISFSMLLEDLFVSLIVASFIYSMINQYMMLSPDSFLYSIVYTKFSEKFAQNFITGSDFFVAVLIFILTFIALLFSNKKMIMYATFLLAMIFAGILGDEYVNQRNKREFVTIYENGDKAEEGKGYRFIYIMLPNATSYRFLAETDNVTAQKEVEKTQDIMLGFYAKNDFTMFTNAYVEQVNPFMNIIDQFNILSGKPSKDAVLDNVMIDGYMKFKNRNEKHVYLEDNELFNNFKHANYKINVYQSHGIELCHSNNEVIADKCVEKFSRPFSFNHMNLSETKKANLLVLQWIDSTSLFKDLSWLYGIASAFTDANKLALIGVPYNNLYVINSVKTLDVIFDDILKDHGNVTYFALIDAPGEMFVYDEFCHIKPTNEWLSKNDLPWVKGVSKYYKKKAYLDQMNCIYGKLQEFLDKLESFDLDEKTVVVVQGISGLNDDVNEDDFIAKMKNEKFVTMAIKDSKKKGHKVSYNFCPTSSVLKSYLYNKKVCHHTGFENLGDGLKREIKRDLKKSFIPDEKVNNAQDYFGNWYIEWLKNNNNQIVSLKSLERPKALFKIEGQTEKAPQENLKKEKPTQIKSTSEVVEENMVEEDGFIEDSSDESPDSEEPENKEKAPEQDVQKLIEDEAQKDTGENISIDIGNIL